jgi:ApaG protein
MSPRPLYHRQSNGIRVTVRPSFLPQQSEPERGHYVFSYAIRIENVGKETGKLMSRYWFIHDSSGEDAEVEGEGVVGEQPVVPPGGVHEYQSFCVLRTPLGYMEGRYFFVRPDGSTFTADIPRFELDAREA